MLKLKKLEILGFKSFCDRTEVKFFGDGIAAIVGPNGCGKSNIADAIAWVLGEQSAKTLRGARMEDVIFAGTRDRNPTGMAEVSLTLIDPEAYAGPPSDLTADPEVEVRDNLPADDWDEAAVRAAAAAETERVSQEFQPGVLEDEEAGDAPEAEAGPDVVLKVRRRNLKLTGLQAGQIVVTRRLFRTGQSEYLLNGKLCRLRDIQEIFLGTGLGPESYAIIEQGRIGQILSSRPHDRRAIIEEAAGITKFKTKKRLAEARLEQAQLNLARINDIFEEVTRQMNSLKRQASKAERYARLREEMRAKLRVVLASKFSHFNQEEVRLQGELASLGEEQRRQGEAVEQREQQQSELTQRGYAIESELAASRERANTLVLEADRASAQQRHNQERCAELEGRSTAARSELEQARVQHANLEAERDANRSVLDSAAADVAAAQAEAERCQQEAAAATLRLSELEQQQEQRRLETLQAIASASEIRNHTAQAEEHLAALGREARRLEQEQAAADSEMEACGGRRGQLALEFESASQKVTALATQITDSRQRLQEKRAAEAEAKQRLDGMRAAHANLLGRRNSLDAVIAEHGYSTESVKRLLQPGTMGNGFRPIGVLADFVEVESQYERVVEDFLRDELNYIVVKSWDSADEGLRLLRTGVDGRATFLVHPQDSQAKFSFVAEAPARPVSPQKTIVPLKSCIRVLNGFGKSLEVILPKLREGYITPDPKVARDLALENPDAFFLASSGECFHNVTVTGGKQRSEGPLSLKRELREVARQLEETESEVQRQEATVATLSKELTALTSLLDRLEEEKREDERRALTSGHSLQQLESDLERSRQRGETCRQELARLLAERQEVETRLANQRETIAAFERRRVQLEQEAAAAQQDSARLRLARDVAAQTAAESSARLAALEERRIAAAAAFDRIHALAAELAARRDALTAQIESFAAERRQREGENLQLAQQLVLLAAEREAAEARAGQLRAESDQARAHRDSLDHELRAARQSLDQVRDRRGELGVEAARLASDRAHLGETCQNDLGLSPEQLLADASALVVTGEQLTAEDAAYHEMRNRLEAMGPVNMMALEEYNETAQRHTFLEGQRKDLLESIANTQNTIRELDVVSRQLFQEAFERINENFQMTFRKLFGGGQGFMRLTDEENTAESGIDVVASPPGKKLQNVLLLSGGEKALTALALLVGIFQYQPSPFCLLDEVDAPLDEANIGRFLDLVREMSRQTQFVLITHSKKTMAAAPLMYGVTMQEPGVSKLVSVKFGEPALSGARA